MRLGKIRRDQITDICAGIGADRSKKVIRGRMSAGMDCGVSLQKTEEIIITHTDAQILKEVRAIQIHRIDIRTLVAEIIDICINITARAKIIHAELPPPITVARIVIFIKNTLAVNRHGLVHPWLQRLVTAHQAKPPLMRDLMHADGRQIVLRAAALLAVKIC